MESSVRWTVTELSSYGQFWCQLLLPSEDDKYNRLHEELQVTAERRKGESSESVSCMYNEGDVCAASFSEDGEWYRARIERVTSGTVRNRGK